MIDTDGHRKRSIEYIPYIYISFDPEISEVKGARTHPI
jgi:hypothetical protein